MPAPDRDKLRAGLSGILSGAPEPVEDVAPTPAPRPTPPPAAEPVEPSRSAPQAKRGGGEAVSGDDGDHVRTTTGYVRAGGEQVHRVSIMLTKRERRRLRDLAEDEGVTITDLVRRVLSL